MSETMDIKLAKLRSDFDNHVKLCDARWLVAWKIAAAVGALVTSVAVAALFR